MNQMAEHAMELRNALGDITWDEAVEAWVNEVPKIAAQLQLRSVVTEVLDKLPKPPMGPSEDRGILPARIVADTANSVVRIEFGDRLLATR